MTESANADQITYWNEVAGAKWVVNQKRLDRVFGPLTQALIEAAALQPGDRVLDVGCGCGETSLLASVKVGSEGHVLAVDISRPMLAHAATREAAGPGAPIEWRHADAMTQAFRSDADVMISRFGVMFFADPLAAFVNLRTALKPGGRLAFISWRPRSQVAWMQWPLDQVMSVLPMPDETTGEPGPFGFADEAATKRMLEEAGFSDVSAVPIDATLTLGAGTTALRDATDMLLDTGPAAKLFREADPNDRAKAEALLRAALVGRLRDEAIRLDGACWLYRGHTT